MRRHLDLDIDLYDNEYVRILVSEPESGESQSFGFPLSQDEHPEFNEQIGNEIYSWLSLWADEM